MAKPALTRCKIDKTMQGLQLSQPTRQQATNARRCTTADAQRWLLLPQAQETGGQGAPAQIRENIFRAKNHVKFGHFANFSGIFHVKFCNFINFSAKYHVKLGYFVNFHAYIFGQQCLAPPLPQVELLRLWLLLRCFLRHPYSQAYSSVAIAEADKTRLCQILQQYLQNDSVFTARCAQCKARYCYRKSFVRSSVRDVDVLWPYRLDSFKINYWYRSNQLRVFSP